MMSPLPTSDTSNWSPVGSGGRPPRGSPHAAVTGPTSMTNSSTSLSEDTGPPASSRRACGVSETECVTSLAGFPRASTRGREPTPAGHRRGGGWMDEPDWQCFIAAYHQEHAGITEQLFSLAGTSPYAWLAEPLRGVEGTVLDLACGSAPTRQELPDTDWVGVDLRPRNQPRRPDRAGAAGAGRSGRTPGCFGERRGGLRGHVPAGGHAPAPDAGGDPACAAARRRARGAGALPVRALLSGMLGWVRVMAALRAVRQPWPNPQARDQLASLLGAAGFRVRSDERHVFTLAIDSADAAALLAEMLSTCPASPPTGLRPPSAPSRDGRPRGGVWNCHCAASWPNFPPNSPHRRHHEPPGSRSAATELPPSATDPDEVGRRPARAAWIRLAFLVLLLLALGSCGAGGRGPVA